MLSSWSRQSKFVGKSHRVACVGPFAVRLVRMTTIVPLPFAPDRSPTVRDIQAALPRQALRSKWALWPPLGRLVQSIAPLIFGVIVPESIAVFQDYDQYQTTASPWRVVVVLITNQWQRVALVFCFPILKRGVRRVARLVVRRFSREFEDLTDEVSGIEICSSIYQVMIMQNAPTVLSTALIIGVDVLQGMSTVLYFMEKSSVVPQQRIVASAVEILSRRAWSMDLPSRMKTASSLMKVSSRRASTQDPVTNASRVALTRSLPLMKFRGSTDCLRLFQSDDKIIVRHALEILHAAEVILMVEYLEIAIPSICTVFMVIASQLTRPTVQSPILYIILQSLSIVAMHWVMWRRYRLSASTLLAFVLERHAGSIQGKMMAWLAALLYFSMQHYGVDFTFKFQFDPIQD